MPYIDSEAESHIFNTKQSSVCFITFIGCIFKITVLPLITCVTAYFSMYQTENAEYFPVKSATAYRGLSSSYLRIGTGNTYKAFFSLMQQRQPACSILLMK